MKNKFEIWLRDIAKKSNGTNYSKTSVNHYISGLDTIKREFNINFWSMNNISEIYESRRKLMTMNSFLKKDLTGKSMYSNSINRYIDFIYYQNNDDDRLEKEIRKIKKNRYLTLEEKDEYIDTIVSIRNPQFQKNFKDELMLEFESKCALCDINDEMLLRASHIIRYSDCENKADRYRSYNGLLLCAGHDALFDKHLISFDENGLIMISKKLDKKLYELLNIDNKLRIEKKYIYAERIKSLKCHNILFREKEKN